MEYGTSTVLNSSLNFSASHTFQAEIKNLLKPIEGHENLWSLPDGLLYEVSSRGHTQVILESFKDLATNQNTLVNLKSLKEAPVLVKEQQDQLKLSWFLGLVYDQNKN